MNCTRRISNLEEMFTWNRASNNFFYKLFHDKVTYETARSNCKRMGANLASAGVRDSTVRSQLISLIKSGESDVWIGLDDLQREGNFIWADGVVSTKANSDWSTNQPDNARNVEDCVYQMHQYCMNRQDFSTGTNQVAKRGRVGKAGPRGPPGIVNYGVINSTILNQFEVLENGLETKFAENFQALERTNSNRDDIEHLQRDRTARELGANLATAGVRDSTVRSQLISLIKSGGSNVWIGLNDLQREGNFIWADGVVSTKANTDWYTNQPDNYSNEDCGHFSPGYGWKLNDAPCSYLMNYLCEKQI
uniref:neurocan core protein-like n=1 Tax=Styela clava TaxID=7725 RepID=UPI00193A10BE|nr:neurocan core protein-like [Styela clava]